MLMRADKKGSDDLGFTLVELMVTLAMSGIIVAAIYSAYNIQQRTYYSQDQVIEVQQNLRSALDVMIREIRMAGYDPDQANVAGIVSASSGSINFTLDIAGDGDDGDGDVDDANENITYGFAAADDADGDGVVDNTAGVASLRRKSGTAGTLQPVAENVEAIEFYYTVFDGVNTSQTLTPANPNQIRSIQISILARAGSRDVKYVNSSIYCPASNPADVNANPPYSDCVNPAGKKWVANNDNFRRRFLITTVQSRNMGI